MLWRCDTRTCQVLVWKRGLLGLWGRLICLLLVLITRGPRDEAGRKTPRNWEPWKDNLRKRSVFGSKGSISCHLEGRRKWYFAKSFWIRSSCKTPCRPQILTLLPRKSTYVQILIAMLAARRDIASLDVRYRKMDDARVHIDLPYPWSSPALPVKFYANHATMWNCAMVIAGN